MKFAGGEPEEEFCVIHVGKCNALFWDLKVNNTGPKMDPCGTPTARDKGLDKVF